MKTSSSERAPVHSRALLVSRKRCTRNLAVIRRHKLTRPSKLALQKCCICLRWSRLGQVWDHEKDNEDWSWAHRANAKSCHGFYCQPCWKGWSDNWQDWWVENTRLVWDRLFYSEPDYPRPPPRSKLSNLEEHFDFIEIGTSHFHTLSQAIVEHPDAKPYAWNFLPFHKHPLEIRGLAVDMVQTYLDQLPDLPNVTKLCAAVSARVETSHYHYVPLASVKRWERIFANRGSWKGFHSIRLARGCSALNGHRILRRSLRDVGLLHLLRQKTIQTITMARLLEQERVKSIGILALDCEGHDCAILQGLMVACDSKPSLWPLWIWFETNSMNEELFGKGIEEETVRQLTCRGYEIWWGGGFKSSGKRDTLLKYNPHRIEETTP